MPFDQSSGIALAKDFTTSQVTITLFRDESFINFDFMVDGAPTISRFSIYRNDHFIDA